MPFVEMETKAYRGDIISIDLSESDFDEVMTYFSDVAGLEVVTDVGVSVPLTLKLTDVPWDQTLDIIVKLFGLRFEVDDAVIRIKNGFI